ncbi:MAG: hypothetical protein ACE5D8_09505 [Fidelibacterota bacterium]
MATTTYTLEEAQGVLARKLNQRVWELLDKVGRRPEENEEMIQAAHASLYHWSQIGTVLNVQRGQWLLSRVYAVLGVPAAVRHYAEACWTLTEREGFTGFDYAYACEAMARAWAVNENNEQCNHWFQRAQ